MQTSDMREGAGAQPKSFLTRQIEERTKAAGEQVGAIADDLRNVGQQLSTSRVAGPVAGYVDQGADLVDRAAAYLREADLDRMMGDLEALARRNPWAVAGGAVVLGFAASRFVKTSSAQRRQLEGAGETETDDAA